MLLTMSFLFWLLLIFVEVDVVHGGGVGLDDCTETRCSNDGPAIRFPFRLTDRQPIDCGFPGFDLSCTKDNQTVLEMPSSHELYVTWINYTSQEIGEYPHRECMAREIFYHGSSSPFKFVGNASLFSCPPSTVRDQYITDSDSYNHCLARLSPCHRNTGNQIYASLYSYDYCPIDLMPLVSCTMVLDYALAPSVLNYYGVSSSEWILRWSIPSCQHCEEMGKACRLKKEFTNRTDPQTQCIDVPRHKGLNLGRQTIKILGSCTLSVILIVMGTIIYYVYSSVKREEENQLRIKRFLDEYKALKPSRYSYADIKRITEQFKEKLGQGAYGTVFKGKLSSELLVAVKILNNSNENGEDFINEVGTMGQIHHVNVVRLVGYCADGFIRALVYEFLPNGPLQNSWVP